MSSWRVYSPTNGDVGILVARTKSKGGSLILNIEGNFTLLANKGVKKVDEAEYTEFLEKINPLAEEIFGFRLGETTYEEAISILHKNGARFKDGLGYKGHGELPIIEVYSYSAFPILAGAPPTSTSLWFVDNKLYEVELHLEGTNINSLLHDGLEHKYKRKTYQDVPSQSNYWLNKNRRIVHNDYGTAGAELYYFDSLLCKKAREYQTTINKREFESLKEKREKNLLNLDSKL